MGPTLMGPKWALDEVVLHFFDPEWQSFQRLSLQPAPVSTSYTQHKAICPTPISRCRTRCVSPSPSFLLSHSQVEKGRGAQVTSTLGTT